MARSTSQSRPHALAQALPRSAGFAVLRPTSRPELDAARILTMSGTLAINLIAMGLLMMPLAMPPPATWEAPTVRHPAREIPRDKPVVVDIVRKAVTPAPAVAPATVKPAAPTNQQASTTTALSEAGSVHAEQDAIAENVGPAIETGAAAAAATTVVQLEYLLAPPPRYPRTALARRIEGTVLLTVLVGIDGRPLDVTVSQSSGNRELDESARSQILKHWSFRPAMRNGQAVQALGLVPVAFALRD